MCGASTEPLPPPRYQRYDCRGEIPARVARDGMIASIVSQVVNLGNTGEMGMRIDFQLRERAVEL